MNSFVIEYLKKKGYKNVSNSYYDYIDLWESWWKNDVDFHNYYDFYNKERKMFSLGIAKRMCEDWASVIWSDRDTLTTNKEQNKDYVYKTIEEFDLNNEIPKAIEISAGYGTCGALMRIKNFIVDSKNTLIKTKNTKKELVLVNAKHIIPLKVIHNKIVDVAFVSDTVVKSKSVIYIEIHELTNKGYKISNVYLDKTNGKEVQNDDVLKGFMTGSNIPLFALLSPPKLNSIKDNMGLGMSIFGDSIDQLKSADVAYNNFNMDFVLGGKKIIYNKKLVKYKTIKVTENGKEKVKEVPVYPDDISKQQFMEVGDDVSTNETDLIHEYNPDLRVKDNKDGVQFALDMASFKAGLGTKYYQFNGSSVVTATQYVGDRQDLVINAKKYRDRLTKFITDIIKASLLIGRILFKEKVTEDCDVIIENVDGFLVDTESAKREDREAMSMGLMSKISYLMKYRGLTEEEAKKELARIDEENSLHQSDIIKE